MIHKDLQNWNQLNFADKMANIGSEAIRVLSWGESQNSKDSLARFEQLLELTIKQEKSNTRKAELKILKKYFVESVKKKNIQSLQEVKKYFIDFAILSRKFL